MEEWRDIDGYDGRYQISNLGNVRSIGYWRLNSKGENNFFKGQNIKTQVHPKNGYVSFAVRNKDGKQKRLLVHRCVAQAFIGDIQGFDVDHINFNRSDNRLENLQILTRKANVLRSVPNQPKLYKMPLNNRQDVKAVFVKQKGEVYYAYPSISAFCGDKELLYEKTRKLFDVNGSFEFEGNEYIAIKYNELREVNPDLFVSNLLMGRKEGCEPRKRRGFIPTRKYKQRKNDTAKS